MGKTTEKSTKMTANEIFEMNNFKELPDLKIPKDGSPEIAMLGKKVWVKMKYGLLRGTISSIDLITGRITIKLENKKFVYIYPYKGMKKNWIKERS